MISIGVDAHNGAHTAVDAVGRVRRTWHGPNSAEGWTELRAERGRRP